jgi:hypothetical protein
MTLGEQRKLFARLLPRLLDYIHDQGFDCTIGEVVRSAAQAEANARDGVGINNSLHKVGLAVDLNLFDKSGKYLVNSSDHKFAGEYWKSLHPLARWGGDFKPKPDGNHYSLEWQGVK